MTPLVSVITPTWRRHGVLLSRCIPSVAAQTYPCVEHIVVSDGPDPELAAMIPPGIRFAELSVHPESERWGGADARKRGLEMARGDLIAYLDDDDAYRPEHIQVLATALERNPGAGFAYTRAVADNKGAKLRIGDGPVAWGRILSCMIMHRREILKTATWRHLMRADDWDLVARWLDAGIGYVSVDAVTCDYFPDRPFTGTPACFPPWTPREAERAVTR